MGDAPLKRIRQIALALPDVNERLSHGAPSFFFRDKRPICYFHDADFASDGRVSLWCRAPSGVNDELFAADPTRFFVPTPSASGVFRDWVGVWLDGRDGNTVDWVEVDAIVRDGWRLVAPKRLAAEFDRD